MNKKSGIESLLCVGPLLVQKIIHFLSLFIYIHFYQDFFLSLVARRSERKGCEDYRPFGRLLLNSPIYNDFNSIRLSNNICRICLFELVLLSLDREKERELLEDI